MKVGAAREGRPALACGIIGFFLINVVASRHSIPCTTEG